ncbi:hypothetical protein AB0C90_13820 [Streptomyces sp. NPDC048550]|uniref:hypothetical protein n=1 Tax=unclassified Streptomyces TaxID=2593676 RepID=UPI00225BCB5D|nr:MULTISPECIES: hypothetical protein [unclassified Streptomyces]MCX5146551.1 hypothetical protein [Streptomyces sp. NBC_00320]WSN49736.1 hypothetical protein OG299_19560 [Streptomyces sp. NBC_01296]WSW60849.1 hypothetical protein OG513_21010 [Streptomyces sp. NBC_00998]
MRKAARFTAVALSAATIVMGSVTVAHAGDYTEDGVRIRSNSTTSASVNGLGYRNHTITPICYKSGTVINGNRWWDRHKNNNTGVTGYSSMTLITKWAANPC